MDEETKAALIAAGWSHSALLDSLGRPYWAWQRGTDYFHVYADSRHRITCRAKGNKVVRPSVEVR